MHYEIEKLIAVKNDKGQTLYEWTAEFARELFQTLSECDEVTEGATSKVTPPQDVYWTSTSFIGGRANLVLSANGANYSFNLDYDATAVLCAALYDILNHWGKEHWEK